MFNKSFHKIVIIVVAIGILIKLPFYFIDISGIDINANDDIGLYAALIIFIALDLLYKNNLMYLYITLLSIGAFAYCFFLIYGAVYADDWFDIATPVLLLPGVILFTLLMYEIPFKVIKKHNKTLKQTD